MEQLPKLQKSLPSDVKLGVIVNTSDNILNTIDSLSETIMYAILFVVLVVFIFLGRWRATVIICITIPMSLIASFIYLAITEGGSLNIISLSCLSIAIGNVVDDAIVVLGECDYSYSNVVPSLSRLLFMVRMRWLFLLLHLR